MGEKYKLGLSRSRLFEFDNRVCFAAEFKKSYTEKELVAAFKMLREKEPLICAAVELDEKGEAYVVTEAVRQELLRADGSLEELLLAKRAEPLDFSQRLFEFYLVGGGIAIFAHTAAADVKSLFFLAGELIAFADRRLVNIEPAKICLFSNKDELSPALFSPLVDSVTADLEYGWRKKSRVFTADDYRAAAAAFTKTRRREGFCEFVIAADRAELLRQNCAELQADCASALCFAFFKAAKSRLHGGKKYSRVSFGTDKRLYLEGAADFGVGPFSASVTVGAPAKKKIARFGELIAYHDEVYQKYSSVLQAFYDETFLMLLSPSFCDAAYMTAAHCFKGKYAKKLAVNYTCLSERMMSFNAFNLDRPVWQGLEGLADITAFEPFKSRDDISVTAVTRDGAIKLLVFYNAEKLTPDGVSGIFDGAKALLKIE